MPTLKAIKESKKRAKLLKKANLLNPEKYDLRKPLTSRQIGQINKLWNGPKHKDGGRGQGWKNTLNNPDIVKRHLSKKKANLLKEQGYQVVNQTVYIPKNGAKEIHVKGMEIVKKYSDAIEKDFIFPTGDILKNLQELSSRPLKTNQYVTVKIGNNAPFNQTFDSFLTLLNYLGKWKPRDKFSDREELIGHMSLVEIFEN